MFSVGYIIRQQNNQWEIHEYIDLLNFVCLNAFIACTHPGSDHTPAFMICRNCDTVAETETKKSGFDLSKIEKFSGFKIEQTVIEAEGLCNSCVEIQKL